METQMIHDGNSAITTAGSDNLVEYIDYSQLLLGTKLPDVPGKVAEEIPVVPIAEKLNLTIREASAYSGIGINRIDRMLRRPNCPFALYVGTRKLVKRRAFEEFLNESVSI